MLNKLINVQNILINSAAPLPNPPQKDFKFHKYDFVC